MLFLLLFLNLLKRNKLVINQFLEYFGVIVTFVAVTSSYLHINKYIIFYSLQMFCERSERRDKENFVDSEQESDEKETHENYVSSDSESDGELGKSDDVVGKSITELGRSECKVTHIGVGVCSNVPGSNVPGGMLVSSLVGTESSMMTSTDDNFVIIVTEQGDIVISPTVAVCMDIAVTCLGDMIITAEEEEEPGIFVTDQGDMLITTPAIDLFEIIGSSNIVGGHANIFANDASVSTEDYNM